MATPLGKSIGTAFSAIGKLGNFILNNPISKAVKIVASAALGPSLFVFGGALSLVGRAVLEVGQIAHTKFIRTFDNTTTKKVQAGWEERLKSYNSFVTSSLKSSMFAWYDAADYVRESWASRQDDAGYGDSNDTDSLDPANVENYATMGGEKGYKKLETIRAENRDEETLGLLPSSRTKPIYGSHSTLSSGLGHGRGGSSGSGA